MRSVWALAVVVAVVVGLGSSSSLGSVLSRLREDTPLELAALEAVPEDLSRAERNVARYSGARFGKRAVDRYNGVRFGRKRRGGESTAAQPDRYDGVSRSNIPMLQHNVRDAKVRFGKRPDQRYSGVRFG